MKYRIDEKRGIIFELDDEPDRTVPSPVEIAAGTEQEQHEMTLQEALVIIGRVAQQVEAIGT